MSVKTKSHSKTLTPRQAQIKMDNLLRGIDNSNVAINKKQGEIAQSLEQIRDLMPTALTQPSQAKPTPAPKPQSAPKPGLAKAQQAKPKAKAAPAKKPAKAAPAKAAPAKAPKPAVKGNPADRPALKDAIAEFLGDAFQGSSFRGSRALANTHAIAEFLGDGVLQGAAAVFNGVNGKYGPRYGNWSRQSVYNCLEKHFECVDKKYGLKKAGVAAAPDHARSTEDEADRFVAKVEETQSTAAVV